PATALRATTSQMRPSPFSPHVARYLPSGEKARALVRIFRTVRSVNMAKAPSSPHQRQGERPRRLLRGLGHGRAGVADTVVLLAHAEDATAARLQPDLP